MLYRLLLGSTIVARWGATLAADPCATFDTYKIDSFSSFGGKTVVVPVNVAYDCLRSIPVNVEEDQALIDEYKLWLNWQSNLGWLKNPPKGLSDSGVDIIGKLDSIKDALSNDGYSASYDLMSDIQAAVVQAHDYHFQLRPQIRNLIAGWKRGDGPASAGAFAMVSISKDGKELPELYDYYDVWQSENAGWSPSPISKINNKTAVEYAEAFAETYEFHDADSRYNQLFPSQAKRAHSLESDDYKPFGRNPNPDGEYTTIEHENGTVRQILNYALVNALWNNVHSVDDLAMLLNNSLVPSKPELQSTNEARQAADNTSSKPLDPAYPVPQFWNEIGGGFFLSGQGYDDVAVLSVPTFDAGTCDDCAVVWQDSVVRFLQEARTAGKKKLVIDIRGNQGGLIYLGYDLFQQLFPSLYPYGATTLHAHDALDLAGQAITKALANTTYEQARQAPSTSPIWKGWVSLFNYRVPLTIEAEPFKSWDELFGPTLHNDSNMTTPQRRNMSNVFADSDSVRDVTGYNSRADKLDRTQSFAADDMVLLTDGSCGSTCAIFSELMKAQGRVQQIAIGGRPKTGPMQGVGGTKGAQVYSITYIRDLLSEVAQVDASLNQTIIGEMLAATRPFERGAVGSEGTRGSATRVNLRDNIRSNDTSLTPLEFVYEAADCRLFYTAEMVRNATAVWRKTVDAHWGDANKTCVEGSVGHESSLSGGVFDQKQPPITTTTPGSSPIPSEAKKGIAGRRNVKMAGWILLVYVIAVSLLL